MHAPSVEQRVGGFGHHAQWVEGEGVEHDEGEQSE